MSVYRLQGFLIDIYADIYYMHWQLKLILVDTCIRNILNCSEQNGLLPWSTIRHSLERHKTHQNKINKSLAILYKRYYSETNYWIMSISMPARQDFLPDTCTSIHSWIISYCWMIKISCVFRKIRYILDIHILAFAIQYLFSRKGSSYQEY